MVHREGEPHPLPRFRREPRDSRVAYTPSFQSANVRCDSYGTHTLCAESDRRGRHGADRTRRRIGGLDHVIGLTGFRPGLSWQSELRLTLDERLQTQSSSLR
jgi:hypothetical protein